MYVSRNTEGRSCDHCCSGKLFSITQSVCVCVCVCVFVVLRIQSAMRMSHIVVWPDPFYNIFPHYLINGTILDKSY